MTLEPDALIANGDITMKSESMILVLSLLLASCGTRPSDADLQQRLVGTWTAEADKSRVIEVRPDGAYVSRRVVSGTNALAEGRWEVKNGYVLGTVTKVSASWPDPESGVSSNKIFRLDERTLVFAGRNGEKGLTLHRN